MVVQAFGFQCSMLENVDVAYCLSYKTTKFAGRKIKFLKFFVGLTFQYAPIIFRKFGQFTC